MWTMNILILSAGTRNKVVQYFKKEIGKTPQQYRKNNEKNAEH